MKKVFLLPVIAACTLGACTSDKTADTTPSTTDQGAIAGPLPEPANSPSTAASSTPDSSSSSAQGSIAETSTSSTNTPSPVQAVATAPHPATNYPKGIPVPNKPGYVLSPYAQYAGLVDVTAYKSGTIVVCPYTHKKFVVP